MLIKRITLVLSLLFSTFVFAQQTPKISQTELLALLDNPKQSNVVILDVRTPQEFAQGHLHGAVNISHDKINDNLAMLQQYKNKQVVVHCRSGRRAVSAEETLKANGFNSVFHLDGDMNAWVEAKLPIEK